MDSSATASVGDGVALAAKAERREARRLGARIEAQRLGIDYESPSSSDDGIEYSKYTWYSLGDTGRSVVVSGANDDDDELYTTRSEGWKDDTRYMGSAGLAAIQNQGYRVYGRGGAGAMGVHRLGRVVLVRGLAGLLDI